MEPNGKGEEEWNLIMDQWTVLDECVVSDDDDESEKKCGDSKAEVNNMDNVNVIANCENGALSKQVSNIVAQRTFTCKKCLSTFPYRTELLYHKCKYKCNKCNIVFCYKPTM